MTTAIFRTRANYGPRLGTAAAAIAVAAACMGLLVVMLTPIPGGAASRAVETGVPSGFHWDAPAHGGIKLIPI